MQTLRALFLTGASMALLGLTPAPAYDGEVAIELMPHRALYELKLESARNGSSVTGAEGQMSFQWGDACVGWSTEQLMNLSLSFAENEGMTISSNYTTWESKDGRNFRFNMRRTANGQLTEEYKGTATIPERGGAGLAYFVVPEKKNVELPAGSFFPTAHTEELLEKARSGSNPLFSATIFDGTEGDGLSLISTVIGRRQAAAPTEAKVGRDGKPDVMWPLRMAFYEQEANTPEPEYEMNSTILPNGVTGDMLLDYGEYTLRSRLIKLEPLPKPNCE